MERWKTLERVEAPFFAPKYGALAGMRILASGTITASNFAACLMGEMGAEVIEIEMPNNIGDPYRAQFPALTNGDQKVSAGWLQNRRNFLSFTLNTNLKYPESKEIFLSLIKNVDVWLENLVWLDKLGITEDMLLEVNPKLIIVHVSGFGRPQFGGDPAICDKPSYDVIGQAEGGYMYLNGQREPGPPHYSASFSCDFLTALFVSTGVLAAYSNVLKGGMGQAIDVAQIETQARVLDDAWTVYRELNIVKGRSGNKVPIFQPAAIYRAKDGRYIVPGAYGKPMYNRFLQALDLDPEYFPYEKAGATKEAVDSPLGQELEQKTKEWFESHTAQEGQEQMVKFKVACGIAKTTAEIYSDPHFHDRGDFIKYKDETLDREIEAFGFVPKFKGTPQQVWRGAPKLGQDTQAILSNILGYSDSEIAAFKGKGIID
ncbi:MAG TPA: CoA transferase [Bacillota bacterium]|nr:CoA transferase [Bacillota bacterium]